MYKDFKKSETLDTGFTSGSSLLWMFSGIILGLLVGLGMYVFSNDKVPRVSMNDSLLEKIQKVQTDTPTNKPVSTVSKTLKERSTSNFNSPEAKKIKVEAEQERRNKFSYYAVLPNLDVPVSSAKPINTSQDAGLTITQQNNVNAQQNINTQEIAEETIVNNRGYLLQVASFRKQSMANKTRGRLSSKGIDAYVEKKKVRGNYWYRVVAGPVDQVSIDSWKYTAEELGHKPLVILLR